MAMLLAFGCALLAAVLLSERAARTVLSTAVLFLATGLAYGSIWGHPDEPVVNTVAELALVTVLLTDGSRASVRELREAWQLPGRALLLGFPVTMAFVAGLAHVLIGVSWTEALLLGAVLSPTDPVLSASIAGADIVPRSVRHLINVESGVNDGIALPFVIALLAIAAHDPFSPLSIATELVGGVAMGVVVPYVAIRLARTRVFGATEAYLRLGSLAAGIVVYAACSLSHANEFLGAFAAGVTIGSASPRARAAFEPLGESLGELLKLGALFLLGALLGAEFVAEVGFAGWAFAVLVIAVARPLAIGIALFGSSLAARDRLVVAWFGPKGFASVVYALLVARAPLARTNLLVHAIAAVILVSIVAHSSTDVPVAMWLQKRSGGASQSRGGEQTAEP